MKPETNAKSQPYKGGSNVIKESPINDHRSGNPTTERKK